MTDHTTTLTLTGEAKLAAAIASGVPLQLATMAVGDGNGAAVDVTPARTALVNEVWRAPINAMGIHAHEPNWIFTDVVVPNEAGGWTVREIGLFDADDDLIAWGSYPASHKPAAGAGAAKELAIRMLVAVSSTAAVDLTIDPSQVLATRAWVEALLAARAKAMRPLNYYLSQI